MAMISFSIQRKLIAGYLVVAILVMAIGYISADRSQQVITTYIGENSVDIATEMLATIDKTIYHRVEELQIYSMNLEVRELVMESNQEFEKLEDIQGIIDGIDKEWISAPEGTITPFMQELMSNELAEELRQRTGYYEETYGYSVFPEAYVTNKYGVIIASTGRTSEYLQADEEWYQTAVAERGFWVSEVEYDESSDSYACDIVINLYDDKGDFAGILKAVLNIEDVISVLDQGMEPGEAHMEHLHAEHETMELRLLTKDGKVIYSTEKAPYEIFEDVPEELLSRLGTKEDKHYFIAIGDKPGEGDRLYSRAHSTGYMDYKGLGWILVIEHETTEIFAPVVELRNQVLILSFVLVAVTGLIGVLISRSVSHSIIGLRDATSEITKGNLYVRVKIESKDELGELGSAFNQMAEELEESRGKRIEYTKELEQEVQKRTSELVGKLTELERTRTAVLNMMEDLQETKNGLDVKVKDRTEELQKAYDQLKEADTVKDDFLAITSHELKTPLTSIIGLTQLIQEELADKMSDDEKEDVSVVLEEANRLKKLIDEILELARLDAGKKVFNMVELDIKKLSDEVKDDLKAFSEQKQIKIKLEQDGVPAVIGDHDSIKRLLYNLTNNAVKYSSGKGENVVVGAYQDKDKVVTYVKDAGIGIPDEAREKVFDRFYQVDSSKSRKYGGTGLGLAICKKIVEVHKGDIWLESKVGEGTTFYFSLPIFNEGR